MKLTNRELVAVVFLAVLPLQSVASDSTAHLDYFDGVFFSYSLGTSWHGSDLKNKETRAGVFSEQFQHKQSRSGYSAVNTIEAGFGKSFDNFNLAASVSHVMGCEHSAKNSFEIGSYSTVASFNIKDKLGLNLMPGFKVSPKALVYTKLSYKLADLRFSINSHNYNSNANSTSSGIGYGLGMKYAFTDHILGFVEYQKIEYGGGHYLLDNIIGGLGISHAYNQTALGVAYKF